MLFSNLTNARFLTCAVGLVSIFLATEAYAEKDNSTDSSNVFTLAVTSDPQIGWCGAYCEDIGSNSILANSFQSMSLHLLKENAGERFKGVIVNGDITHTMEDEQLTMYRALYADKFVTYPGLGNHDYEEYTPTRNDTKHACGLGYHLCLQEMVDYVVEATNANPLIEGIDYKLVKHPTTSAEAHTGSLAYYFDIGDYRFVQLQNHPAYELTFGSAELTTASFSVYDIKQSFEWLEKLLERSDGKTIILNMHEMNTDDGFSAYPNLKVYVDPDSDVKTIDQKKTEALKKLYGDGYRRLQKLLGKYDNIGAIFAGHNHSLLGDQHEYKKIGEGENEFWKIQKIYSPRVFKTIGKFRKDIPVFYSGSADYNKYLRVDFKPREMTVTVIDSSLGPFPFNEALDENGGSLQKTVSFPIPEAFYFVQTKIDGVTMELSYFGATASKLPMRNGRPQYIAAFTKNTGKNPVYLEDTVARTSAVTMDINGNPYQLVKSTVSAVSLGASGDPVDPQNGETGFAVWVPVPVQSPSPVSAALQKTARKKAYRRNDYIEGIYPKLKGTVLSGEWFALEAQELVPDVYGRFTGVWLENTSDNQQKVAFDWVPVP